MANAHAPQGDKYYIPHGSPWPIFGSVTMFTVMVGAVSTMEGLSFGPGLLTAGFVLLACLFVPFGMVTGDKDIDAVLIGLMTYLGKVVVLAVLLPIGETSVAKMRVFRYPIFLGSAFAAGALAVFLLFVSRSF